MIDKFFLKKDKVMSELNSMLSREVSSEMLVDSLREAATIAGILRCISNARRSVCVPLDSGNTAKLKLVPQGKSVYSVFYYCCYSIVNYCYCCCWYGYWKWWWLWRRWWWLVMRIMMLVGFDVCLREASRCTVDLLWWEQPMQRCLCAVSHKHHSPSGLTPFFRHRYLLYPHRWPLWRLSHRNLVSVALVSTILFFTSLYSMYTLPYISDLLVLVGTCCIFRYLVLSWFLIIIF